MKGISAANRTASRRFYTVCSLGKPDMPRNLTPFLYRLFPGQTGHAPKPHAVFIPSVPWANRTCPETSRRFYTVCSLGEPDMPTVTSQSARSADNWVSVGKSGQTDRFGGDHPGHRVAHRRCPSAFVRVPEALPSRQSRGCGGDVQRSGCPFWGRRPMSCSVTDSWAMARRMSSASQSNPLSTCSARKDQTKLDSTGHMSSGPR